MEETGINRLLVELEKVGDPRICRQSYPLTEILFLTLCASICGFVTFKDMALFGKHRLDFLRKYLPYLNRTPSEDTIGLVFSLINPKQFTACLQAFTKFLQGTNEKILSLDGKTARSSFGKNPALHAVNVFSSNLRLCLGFGEVDSKTNEITALPELLRIFNLQNTVVTIDAMGCQTEVAKTIIENQGDYLLALKGNQKNDHQDVVDAFNMCETLQDRKFVPTTSQTLDKDHGRVEIRRYSVLDADKCLSNPDRWPGIKSVTMVDSIRTTKKGTTHEKRYYISSLPTNSVKLANAIRGHWGVENSLHYILDVALDEDLNRARTANAQANLAILRRITLNLLQLTRSSNPTNFKNASIAGMAKSCILSYDTLSLCLSYF